jgi:hypothetical protein
MKIRTGLLMLAFCAAALAQSTNGYVFFAPGGLTSSGHTGMTIHAGGGADVILGKGLGLGAEIGALGPREDLSAAVGMFSPNASFHFIREKGRKADPFVTGGYTLMFRSGTANLFNFGAGANYWFRDHLGLRVEFRDHVYTRYATLHYWGLRVGLSFR